MKKSKWTKSQIELLIEKAKAGGIRMHAFEEVARQTRRKANSVRNYYYKNLADDKAKIVQFAPSEVKQVLREIVLGTSRGESVRSICLRLACGDKSKMLRYQNKYRAVLRSTPQSIEDVKTVLEGQGYFVKSPALPHFAGRGKGGARPNFSSAGFGKAVARQDDSSAEREKEFYRGNKFGKAGDSGDKTAMNNVVTLPVAESKKLTDNDINNLFFGLMRLVKKQAVDSQVDGLRHQVEALKAEIERLKAGKSLNRVKS